MIDSRYVIVYENRQQLHRCDQIADGGVFEIYGRCSLRVMTPVASISGERSILEIIPTITNQAG